MSNLLKLFSAILFVALAGCATQKQMLESDDVSGVLYRQALMALDGRRFTIELTEAYPSSGEAPVPSAGSYISMDDGRAFMRISPDIQSRIMRSSRQAEACSAAMTTDKSSKNGDRQYRLKIKDNAHNSWMSEQMVITLYKGTNQCLVQFPPAELQPLIRSFKGRVIPLKE